MGLYVHVEKELRPLVEANDFVGIKELLDRYSSALANTKDRRAQGYERTYESAEDFEIWLDISSTLIMVKGAKIHYEYSHKYGLKGNLYVRCGIPDEFWHYPVAIILRAKNEYECWLRLCIGIKSVTGEIGGYTAQFIGAPGQVLWHVEERPLNEETE